MLTRIHGVECRVEGEKNGERKRFFACGPNLWLWAHVVSPSTPKPLPPRRRGFALPDELLAPRGRNWAVGGVTGRRFHPNSPIETSGRSIGAPTRDALIGVLDTCPALFLYLPHRHPLNGWTPQA